MAASWAGWHNLVAALFESYAMTDVTQILNAIEQGDPSAVEWLLPLVYEKLWKLATSKSSRRTRDVLCRRRRWFTFQ
jgi:hypothetical protein